MADIFTGGMPTTGEGTSPLKNILSVLGPVGLGVAAAAHPALARGASAITAGMGAIGRNKRLAQVMKYQEEQQRMARETQGMAKEEHEQKMAIAPYQRAKAQFGSPMPTGGGGYAVPRYSEVPGQAPTYEQVVPEYAGSDREAKALALRAQIQKDAEMKAYREKHGLEAEEWSRRSGVTLQQQKELKGTPTWGQGQITPQQAATDRMAVLQLIEKEKNNWIEAQGGMGVEPADLAKFQMSLWRKYGPTIKHYESLIPGIQSIVPELPPTHYIPHPEHEGVWYDPNNPKSKPFRAR